MKKVLVLMLMLALATMANATLKISVDGEVDTPDTELEMIISEHAVIDVTASNAQPAALALMLFVEGPGALSITASSWILDYYDEYDEVLADITEDPSAQGYLIGEGYSPGSIIYIEIAKAELPIPDLPDGKIVDLLDFHCTGLGDATIILFDASAAQELDRQVIHQIPEPATIALLGLGGLLLRRRK